MEAGFARSPRTASEGTTRRIVMVLPYDMTARNVLTTGVLPGLGALPDCETLLVTRAPGDAESIARLGGGRCRWRALRRPFRPDGGETGRGRRLAEDLRFALGFYLHLSLAFRFNSIENFRGFRDRLRQSRRLRRMAFREGLPSRRLLGWPWRRSRRLFGLLSRLYYGDWQRQRAVERLFDEERPDALVLGHLQNPWITPYLLAARRRGVPVLGLVGSWDQPTTKGPLCPGLDRILAQSAQVRDELVRHHGVAPGDVEVVGWPQMDIYKRPGVVRPRGEVLRELGLDEDARYLLFGAYSERLGWHEPAVCRELAAALQVGRFGEKVTLCIRPHPLDSDWRPRLGPLHDPPHVVVGEPMLGDVERLANLVAHAEALIASAGTINLDAVAFDTPSIALAWHVPGVPEADQPARRYDMEHYAAVLRDGAIALVHDRDELFAALDRCLADRGADADARAALVARSLAPFDGRAAERIVAAIADFVGVSNLAEAPRWSSSA